MALRLLTKCISRIMALLFLYGKPYFKIKIIVINFSTRIDFDAHPACWLIFTGREKFCINPPIQVLERLWHFPSTREHRPSICRHFLNRQPCRYITARISRSNCIVKIPLCRVVKAYANNSPSKIFSGLTYLHNVSIVPSAPQAAHVAWIFFWLISCPPPYLALLAMTSNSSRFSIL